MDQVELEMLKMAALAIGLRWVDGEFCNEFGALLWWNPLGDSKDAFAILIECGFSLQQFTGDIPQVIVRDGHIAHAEFVCGEPANGNAHKAARLAITKAAAARGRLIAERGGS
jgi:hypothetical protein